MKKIKNILRNERGLTLIELLAVVVILAIIAAIAIPAIGGLMDNTRKDAHVANAQQMVSSARLYLTGDKIDAPSVSLEDLIKGGYMEDVEDPDSKELVYKTEGQNKFVETNAGYNAKTSIVTITDGKVTKVTLIGSERKIDAAANALNRDAVVKK